MAALSCGDIYREQHQACMDMAASYSQTLDHYYKSQFGRYGETGLDDEEPCDDPASIPALLHTLRMRALEGAEYEELLTPRDDPPAVVEKASVACQVWGSGATYRNVF